MTAKRFMVDDAGTLIDMQTRDMFDIVEEVCPLLNEQHEQIQELIQFSKEFEEDCQSTFNAMSRKQDDLYRKNFKLKEENEELKYALIQEQEVSRELKSQVETMINIFNDSGLDYHISDELEDILKG